MNKVLFLGLNYNQIPYLKEIKNLGFYVVGTDLNTNAPAVKIVDKFYKCGYNDYGKLIDIGKKEAFGSNDKVFTASSQFAHMGAAHFAQNFNINYPKIDNIKLCLDKFLYYTYFENNNIPLPKTWYIKTKEELENILAAQSLRNSFYLKSDNSKNPKYVYNFVNKDLKDTKINWEKDRYFQKYYILQEEFYGEHIRVNIFGNKLSIYPFDTKKLIDNKRYQIDLIKRSKVPETLKKLIEKLDMKYWLLKFDIVINENLDFVVLDIGIDPPYRMYHDYKNKNISFEKYYCRMYLLYENDFKIFDGTVDD